MIAARAFRSVVLTLGLLAGLATTATARCEDWVPQPKPQNASRDIVGQELDVILDRGWIEFAVFDDYPPYSFEEGGQPRGIDIDIGKLIAEDLGVAPRFKLVAAGENLDADLRNTLWQGPVVGGAVSNVMLRVPYDSAFTCRVEQVVFTGQYQTEGIAIAYNKAAYPEEKPVPAYFRFDTVAVENDSIADFYLTSLAGGQLKDNIRRFPDMTQVMAALAAGEVKAAMGPKAQLEYGLTDDLAVHQPPLPGFAVGNWTIGLGVNFRYRPLAYAVDDAIYAALSDGRIAAIFESYGLSFTPPER
ncbi:bacterial extracellular solute-binding protein, family 3 [Antarctobacter heliothermus]|uniref:Bacterial extracellular solute-binding protein, family 3 n=1 Tax=Antarctobacter heliothermus TaxID=74033 RepID=A0A222E0F8_9RHOB|nr:transporter substrate-binding domain-containing protein [Antarctobacter heliothermus]ASP19622.1 bacterial extracellular solute-binding protein, family 3 [Antarctobacter heliothermus]MBT53118.1 amino acid ABC transporter substrate-binding protein [Mameliella sp.]|tara:strand:+ start:27651 stop:28556 length:906 start_codon:yes stop_codon:yes gene_type:complete